MGFLEDRRERAWEIPAGGRGSFTPAGHYVGNGRSPLEVAVAQALRQPNDGDVRNLWKRRKDNKPSPLLLVVLWPSPNGERASVCGPGGDEPTVYGNRDPLQIARIANLALNEPDHHAARRLVEAFLPEEGGVRNRSLFASHHLIDRVPQRSDWETLCQRSLSLLSLRREELIEALGFDLEPSGQAVILRSHGNTRAMAVFLGHGENPEAVSTRFNGMTPVSWAIARATADNIPYVIVERGDQLRIHATRTDVASRSSAFVELNLPLLTATDAGYLTLLFSADSLSSGGIFERLLVESHDFAFGLGDRLRSRVYEEAVPAIADALIAKYQDAGGSTDAASLAALYNRTLLVLFRLLFVAYSEDRGLLPLQTNDLYRQRSLKHLARELANLATEHGIRNVPYDEFSTDYWDNVRALWAAIDRGRAEWNVPPYNGGLFSYDADINSDGAALSELSLTNAEFGPCLLGLLVDRGDDEFGPIDFANLDVREFGTIYEGLLESDLAVAPCDLTIDADDIYLPTKNGEEVIVAEGQIYLHNQSGARKSSGSYFTKPFAVQHLLEHALEPALDKHLARLAVLLEDDDDIAVARDFFDFRCVDLSMGSGHFLVAAVDHIERRFSEFLSIHRITGVLDELDRLGHKSAENLAAVGLTADDVDTSALLRRQIARRCIYGVDLNPTSVELARLALWIHTFVKGLPLTSLNHGLVVGNSLTGIGTLDEVIDVLDPGAVSGTQTFVSGALEAALRTAQTALVRFAEIGEADKAEVKIARDAQKEAERATASAKILCDFAVAVRLGDATLPPYAYEEDQFLVAAEASGATQIADGLGALHFPVVFPEVFLRSTPGFDCIVGNPPYDKVRHEPKQFWVTRQPGLRTMSAKDQDAAIDQYRNDFPVEAAAEVKEAALRDKLQHLAAHAYLWQGRGQHGHHDFAKMFVERALRLSGGWGAIGYVLPRTSLVIGGWTDLRRQMTAHGAVGLLQARNKGGWLFDDVHNQLMFVLFTRHSQEPHDIEIWPAVTSPEQVKESNRANAIVMTLDDIENLSEKHIIPWFTSRRDLVVFDKLKRIPRRLGKGTGWILGTADSSRWDFSGSGPQQSFLGPNSADAWQVLMTRHVDLYRIAIEEPFQRHVSNPADLVPLNLGVVLENDKAVLSRAHPTIVFRYPSMNDNSRTLIATALPSSGFLFSKGYVSGVRTEPDVRAEDLLALLAFMNSWTCDWWVRRWVDRHVTKQTIENLPLPDWSEKTRTEIAGICSYLLGEKMHLPGGLIVEASKEFPSRETALLAVERAVIEGLGLDKSDLTSLLEDFTDNGCEPTMRNLLLGEAS